MELYEDGELKSVYVDGEEIEAYVLTLYYRTDGLFEDQYGYIIFNIERYVTPVDIYMIQRTNNLLLWKSPTFFVELVNLEICRMLDYNPDYWKEGPWYDYV